MLTSLTAEQEALFPDYVDKWLKIGLSTDDVDVGKSMAALKLIYEQSDLEFPDKYELYDSPFAAVKAMKDKYDIDVYPKDFIYGCHEAAALSFYDFFIENTEIEITDKIKPFMDLAKHCGWVLMFDELVVLTQKPVSITWDTEKRLHSEDDFAIKFRDGMGIASWHGTRIPSEWILDRSNITADICLHWANIEQRRSACEILGWANVLEKLNAKTINEDDDPTIGTLVEVELPDAGTERFLIAEDPNTGKPVGLPVPPHMETALEANSWTYGIEKFDFKPDFRV